MRWFNKLFNRGGLPKQMIAVRSAFKAGGYSNLFARWTGQNSQIQDVVTEELHKLRARSRDLALNNDYVRRCVTLFKANVVGDGIALQSKARLPDGAADKDTRRTIEAGWEEWGLLYADITGQRTWTQILQQMMHGVFVDGEAFLRYHVGGGVGGVYGVAVELIDPVRVPEAYNTKRHSNGNRISNGIEYDPRGRPVAYYVAAVVNEMGVYSPDRVERVLAVDMQHVYDPEYINQGRGIPQTATAMPTLRMLDGLQEAAITALREGASKQLYIATPDQDYGGADGRLASGEMYEDIQPGLKTVVPTGTELLTYNPSYPNGEYPEFCKSVLRRASSGLRLSYPSVANDHESINFSSGRLARQEETDQYKLFQYLLITRACMPTFRLWIQTSVRWLKASNARADAVESWRHATWQARRWPWVDPLKEVQASVIAVNNGFKSRSGVIRENGGEPENVLDEIKADQSATEDAGIEITGDAIAIVGGDDDGQKQK